MPSADALAVTLRYTCSVQDETTDIPWLVVWPSVPTYLQLTVEINSVLESAFAERED